MDCLIYHHSTGGYERQRQDTNMKKLIIISAADYGIKDLSKIDIPGFDFAENLLFANYLKRNNLIPDLIISSTLSVPSSAITSEVIRNSLGLDIVATLGDDKYLWDPWHLFHRNDIPKKSVLGKQMASAEIVLAITSDTVISFCLHHAGIEKAANDINAFEGVIYQSKNFSKMTQNDKPKCHLHTTETRDNDHAMFDGNEKFDTAVAQTVKGFSPKLFGFGDFMKTNMPPLLKTIQRPIDWVQKEISRGNSQ